MAAEIRRQAERDAASLRRDAAEWASSIRREAEARAARTLPARVDTAGDAVPGPEPEVEHDPEPDALVDLTQPDQIVDLSVLPSPVAPAAPAPSPAPPTPVSPTATPPESADAAAALEAALRSVLPAPMPASPPLAEPAAATAPTTESAVPTTGPDAEPDPEPILDPSGAAAELPDDPYEVGRLVALGSWMDAADFAGPSRPTGVAAGRPERGSGDVIDLGRVVESRRQAELRRAEAAEQAERRARAGFRPVETSIETRVHDIVRQAVRRTFSRRSS